MYIDKYLRLSLLIGRARIKALNFVCERVKKRIDSWSSNFLSPTGCETLLQSITSTFPNYVLLCFAMPQAVCEDLSKMLHTY